MVMSRGVPVRTEIGGAESTIRVPSKRVATIGISMIVPHNLRSERLVNGEIVSLTCLLYSHHGSMKYVSGPRDIRLGVVFSLDVHHIARLSPISRPSLALRGNCDTKTSSRVFRIQANDDAASLNIMIVPL